MTVLGKYNGWTNKPTWQVNLWLSNDEYEYRSILWMVREAADTYELARLLKDYIEENNPYTQASLYSDLLGFAMAIVDYDELARHFWDDYRDQVTDDDTA